MADPARALQLKEEGNKFYQQKNYPSAEAMYSKAIIADPKNPALYTNRAMARLKLKLWDHVAEDCYQALVLEPSNMKAFYQLSQAQLELHAFDESVASARKAHELCFKNNDRSIQNIMIQLRKAIGARWDDEQRRRFHTDVILEAEAIELFEQRKIAVLQECADLYERQEVLSEWDNKITRIDEIFKHARQGSEKKKPPPDWLLCPISFQVMLDPVMTRAGHTYDRHNIEEHIKQHQNDPFTRENLYLSDLRPNLAIKEACEAWLEKHGDDAEY